MEEVIYACLILLPMGISLRMSLRLLYGARGPRVDDPIHQMIRVAATTLIFLSLLVLVLTMSAGLGVILLVVFAFAGLETLLAHRAMQRRAVWKLIRSGFLESPPSEASLGQQQKRFTGIVGRAYRRLLRSLQQGADLRLAIASFPRAVPDEAQAFAAVYPLAGEKQQPGEGADRMHQRISDDWGLVESQMVESSKQLSQRLAYIGIVLLVMAGIVSFLMIKIVPECKAIFDDFDLELPQITASLISVSAAIFDSPVSSVLGIILVLFIPSMIVIFICYLIDIPMLKPFADWLFFSRHRAMVLRLLADATERGQTLVATCGRLTGDPPRYPSALVRNQLAMVRREIAAGRDWKEALRLASFLRRADYPVIEAAERIGNLPWVLRMLANDKLRKMVFRWTTVEQIAFPCAILLIGFVVMWICVALFVPLVSLINGLA